MAAAQVAIACRPLMQPYTIYCYTAYHVLPVYFAALRSINNNNNNNKGYETAIIYKIFAIPYF